MSPQIEPKPGRESRLPRHSANPGEQAPRALPCRRPGSRAGNRGFALVITLSLMVLLTIVAVGLLSLSAIGLRSSNHEMSMATARANARLALSLAIGELQKSTGPDQRITMTANLRPGQEPANPNWTGAVASVPADGSAAPAGETDWLVSGTDPDPGKALARSAQAGQGDALKLGSFGSGSARTSELLAPVVELESGGQAGRYAWWIGDEGTKARVDIEAPDQEAAGGEAGRLARAQSPLAPGLEKLGDAWTEFGPDGEVERPSVISIETAALAAGKPAIGREYFNDITTGGFGLPVNVAAGGMKADLSLVFDRSQMSKKFGENYFGATASNVAWNGSRVVGFAVKSPAKFYLSDAISKKGSVEAGPNWGNLWNYASLWQSVTRHQTAMIGAHPLVESDLRFKNWLPYTNHNQGSFRRDLQHHNSPVSPVLSFFQMGFRLNSERMPADPASPASVFYKAQIGIQPVVGIWNPYNVTIRAAPYRFDWALYPYFRFNYAKPTGNGTFTDGRLTTLWLREEWTSGSSVIPTPGDGSAGKWLQLETPPVDLQPGEFRLFSVLDRVNVRSGQTYSLKPGWSEKGAFIVDLKDASGSVRLVPAGYRAWFGTLVLQDTQSREVKTKFPSLDTKSVSSTWFTLKSGNNILCRSTEIWNGGSDPAVSTDYLVPEPVISGSSGGLDTTKTTYLIDDLAGDKVTPNIATWSFFLRTSSQIEAPDLNQNLRGWIDSNPRALVTNSLWDGSKVSAGGERTGWHSTSQFMGAWNAPGKPKVVGDGRGGNRGLLSEAGSAISEPEVSRAGGRYQGFGGAANTMAGGRNHVITYDVPRSPLVSIGQFQHAQLSRYNFEPGFVAGNSYANPRIPLGATANPDFSGVGGLNVTDISYDVNRRLWDGYFFSTLAPDYAGASGNSFDKVFDFAKLSSGEESLPNPRMIVKPLGGDAGFDTILSDAGDRAPEAIAARILVKGAFNVNSTSVTAWKALLSSMGSSGLPVLDPETGNATWTEPEGIRFNRFGHVLSEQPYQKGGAGDDDAFWQGWRSLSDEELDQLAAEMVKEVKERGPFRSMAEFVNRKPEAGKPEHQLKGALQAALDRTVNTGFPGSVGKASGKPPGSQYSAAMSGENSAAGNASYLMQGDVLQSLAPVLQPRSDYFRVRACGEALDSNGKVAARAWCEAFVQRSPDYVDPVDPAYKAPAELSSGANQLMGRRYRIVSFRWLPDAEI